MGTGNIIYDHNFTGGYCLIEQKMRITHSRKKSPKYETNRVGLKRWRLWHLKAKMSTKHTYRLCELWGRVLPILLSAFLTTTGHSPAQVFFSRCRTRNRLLFMFLVLFLFSAPLRCPHKVSFTTQWCVLLYLLKVGGKWNIIELVLFLLANKSAMLRALIASHRVEPILKFHVWGTAFGSCSVTDSIPSPRMPTTTFKYERYHFYPQLLYFNMGIRKKILQLFTYPKYKSQGTEQPHGKKNGSFFLKPPYKPAILSIYLLMSKQITIFIQMFLITITAILFIIGSPGNSPVSQ